MLVYYTRIPGKWDDAVFARYKRSLPAAFQYRIEKFKRWQDAHACLAGKLLLLECLKALGREDLKLEDIKFTQFNKPYFNNTSIDFNISHSGSYVICAAAKHCSVGIDVEEISGIAVNDFQYLFREDEWKEICNAGDVLKTFYSFWTTKEAVIKADGRGLGMSLQKIRIHKTNAFADYKNWFLRDIPLDENYACCLASDKEISAVSVKHIIFPGTDKYQANGSLCRMS